MAITGGDRYVWRALRHAEVIPDHPSVLEIGRANWYGDVPQSALMADWEQYGQRVPVPPMPVTPWAAADWYYQFMLRRPVWRMAVDLDPQASVAGPAATVLQCDLNQPLPAAAQGPFDIVINSGTCEHIFDQRQVWQSMDHACKGGGLLVHALPLWGWLDHGFYNYHPTFVADVAAANGYEILVWVVYEIATHWLAPVSCPADIGQYQHRAASNSALMHVAFRKTTETPFRVPQQSVYSERATSAQLAAWRRNR